MYGKRLREERKRLGLTLEQVAQRLNTTHTNVSRYENKKRKVDVETLAILCRLYNVSADYIIGLTDERKTLK